MPSNPLYTNEKYKRRSWDIQLILKLSVGLNALLFVHLLWSFVHHGGRSKVDTQPTRITVPSPPAAPSCTNSTFLDVNVTQQRKYFREQYSNNTGIIIKGWLTQANMLMAFGIMRAQTRACITGSVGEIGVHHGRHFIPLVLGSLPHEHALAVDLFEQQELNVDKSGSGNKTIFLQNMARYGIPQSRVGLLSADSSKLKPSAILKLKVPRFRFLSVDGGHTYELTMSDLKLAAALIQPGGVIALDDVPNLGWLGVQEAMYDFLSLNRSIAPFLFSCQKLYFTTADYHAHYLKLADQLPCGECSFSLRFHASRYTIRDWPMCVKMTTNKHKPGIDKCTMCEFNELPLTTLALPPPAGRPKRKHRKRQT